MNSISTQHITPSVIASAGVSDTVTYAIMMAESQKEKCAIHRIILYKMTEEIARCLSIDLFKATTRYGSPPRLRNGVT